MQQRMQALTRANEIRGRRSELKADMRTGRVKLADVLLSDADWLQSMRVRDLLLATPGIGPLKTNRALQACWTSSTISLRRTSHERRVNLLEWIERRHPMVNVGTWVQATPEEATS